VTPNGGTETPSPRRTEGCLVLAAVALVFLIGVAVGFFLCKGLG
jgi:hypothetical protein